MANARGLLPKARREDLASADDGWLRLVALALASWLLAPASTLTIRERNEAIAELRPRLDLREDLELLGVEVRAGIDPGALAAWGTARRVFPGSAVPIAAAILGIVP